MSYDPYAPREAEETGGYNPIKRPLTLRDILRKLWAPIAAIGFLFWKLKFLLVAIFKFKIFTVAGSMLVSIGAYALLWGWQFAVGFVLLLLVHELGHVLEAKRQGLPVSAPMFIPFLVALAFTGFFLNLFNLAPISPLDGGRIVAAIHPGLWIVGLIALVGLTIVAPNPILILILILGGLESWRRWQHRRHPESEAYYRVSPSRRLITGVAYIGLAALLTLGMSGTFVE